MGIAWIYESVGMSQKTYHVTSKCIKFLLFLIAALRQGQVKYVPVLVNVQGYLWNESEAGFPQHLSVGRHTGWPCQSLASLTLQRDRAQHTYHHEQRQHGPKGGSRAREEGAESAGRKHPREVSVLQAKSLLLTPADRQAVTSPRVDDSI